MLPGAAYAAVLPALLTPSPLVFGQSLAEAARQEKERRRKIPKPVDELHIQGRQQRGAPDGNKGSACQRPPGLERHRREPRRPRKLPARDPPARGQGPGSTPQQALRDRRPTRAEVADWRMHKQRYETLNGLHPDAGPVLRRLQGSARRSSAPSSSSGRDRPGEGRVRRRSSGTATLRALSRCVARGRSSGWSALSGQRKAAGFGPSVGVTGLARLGAGDERRLIVFWTGRRRQQPRILVDLDEETCSPGASKGRVFAPASAPFMKATQIGRAGAAPERPTGVLSS